jgi:hypothetical protein
VGQLGPSAAQLVCTIPHTHAHTRPTHARTEIVGKERVRAARGKGHAKPLPQMCQGGEERLEEAFLVHHVCGHNPIPGLLDGKVFRVVPKPDKSATVWWARVIS